MASANYWIRPYNPKLKSRARRLRKNMTEAEVVLWNHLRKRQIKSIQFLRQKPIGHYIVDFYAPEIRLVIEVDGGQHFGDEAEVYDQKRDAFLASQKLKVIRFSNLDVLQNIQGVIERIAEAVQ